MYHATNFRDVSELCESRPVSFKSGGKGGKELGLGNAAKRASDQMLHFSTTGILQRRKAPDVK